MRRITQEEWQRRAAAAGFVWTESVAGAQTKTGARCLTCGCEFTPFPSNVPRQGCPSCARLRAAEKQKRPQSDWIEAAKRTNLKWLEPVTNSQTSTLAECLSCGHCWSVRPQHVWNGHGCGACGRKAGGKTQRLGQEEWVARAALVNAEWLEDVRDAQSKASARCRVCGHEWAARPN